MDERDQVGGAGGEDPRDARGRGKPSRPQRPEKSASDLVRQLQAGAAPDRRSQQERRGSARRRKRFWNRFLLVVAMAAVVVVVVPIVIGRGSATTIEFPPDELLGTWSTDEPRYEDRKITITREEIDFDLGADGRQVYPIQSIELEVADVHRMYTIHYADEGGDQTMELFVYNDGLLRLRNPSEVRWTREGS